MKTILLFLLTLIFFSSCTCPPKLADGTKPPCRYVGPSITMSLALRGVSVGATLWGEPSQPTIVIPINKHDPLPVYTK